ncbi:hypothetical protein KAR91_62600 [Candidatus Pacearchaeota archaeon]|nr:hypothetical protein [Candidatus Pacearchaeota archaeon]
MAVNRDKVKKQMADSKARSGKFRYLAKDSTTALRILEFEDAEGEIIFARPFVEHREVNSQGGKALGVCRKGTFGEPCAFCKVNHKRRDGGEEPLYSTKTRYAVNGIDINEKGPAVRKWMLPTTLYDQVAEYVMDEEWADILEAKPGTAFNCKREGSGLDTTYTAKVQRKPWPVSPALMKQVSDPLTDMGDPGLKSQCEELGYELSDLFDDAELEEAEKAAKGKGGSKKDKKTSSKKTSKKSEPATPKEIDIGVAVKYEDEDVVYHVTKIDGDDVEIEDNDENVYDATMDQLSILGSDAEPEEEEPEPEKIEVGSEVHYDGEEAICTVKSIDGDDVVIEDGDGEQFDVQMGDLAISALGF